MIVRHFLFILLFAQSSAFALPFVRVEIGKSKSRGLWLPAKGSLPRPAILLIPPQGPHGPEVMIPAKFASDQKYFGMLLKLAEPFAKENFNVLLLGKPGIEYFTSFVGEDITREGQFYDPELYRRATWSVLVENVAAGFNYIRQQPSVDRHRVYLLGHSQGSVVITDFAARHPEVKPAGLLLLGFSGQPIGKITEWMMLHRTIEHFFKSDVDIQHKGYVDRKDAEKWNDPIRFGKYDFNWKWKPNQKKYSFQELEKRIREETTLDQILENIRHSVVYKETWGRPPLYASIAKLSMPLYLFTGELDMDTPKEEIDEMLEACKAAMKKNCFGTIVPGVGHGFSPPRGPRRHPLLDMTLGPPQTAFLEPLAKVLGQK